MRIQHPTGKANFSSVQCGALTVYFSYETPIGLHHPETGAVVRVNDWSNTTGKHICYVEREYGLNRKARIAGETFCKLLSTLRENRLEG